MKILLRFCTLVLLMLALTIGVRSQQAVLSVSDVAFAQPIEAGVPDFGMIVELQNSGRSTATIDDMQVVISHEFGGLPSGDDSHVLMFPLTVPYGEKVRKGFKFDIGQRGWLPETAAGVREGTLKFYVSGVFRYHDVLDFRGLVRRDAVQFCFAYRPPAFAHCPGYRQ